MIPLCLSVLFDFLLVLVELEIDLNELGDLLELRSRVDDEIPSTNFNLSDGERQDEEEFFKFDYDQLCLVKKFVFFVQRHL